MANVFMKKPLIFCGLLLCALGVFAQSPTDGVKGYHDYAAVVKKLQDWASKPQASLEEIGKSQDGKSLYVLTIAGEGSVDSAQRPGVFVGANIAGYHNAGTEAALHLIEYLLTSKDAEKALRERTFYIAPILNPDSHDAFFGTPRSPMGGNGGALDRDLDGFFNEDGLNDLNKDGLITKLRIKDPAGNMIPDPDNPFAMRKADPKEGEVGQYRMMGEGDDDDNDGKYNEDGPGGIHPDRNFAHAFDFDNPDAGPWASVAPESKAIMDFLLAKRNIALAVVYGPANNFLEAPKSLGGAVDTGSVKFELPKDVAEFLGFDPEEKYSLDEVWAVAKDLPMVVQNNLTKEDVAQFLGVGPATKVADDDAKMMAFFADKYKERLEKAGLDNKRAGKQYKRGGFTPWLYYQYGAMAVELDVWGVPKKPEKKEKEDDAKLTIDKLEKMSSEDFLALGEEAIAAFMKENNVPPQYSAETVMGMVKSGQVNPEKIAGIMKEMGAGGGKDKKSKGPDDLQVFVETHAPWAKVDWTPVELKDGTKAEVGGIDPFIKFNPPHDLLAKPMEVHTQTVMEMSDHLAEVVILKSDIKDLGSGVYSLQVTVGNKGTLSTHTSMAKKSRVHLPVRLGLVENADVEILQGPKWATSDQLNGRTSNFTGKWLVRVKKGAALQVKALSDNAGSVIDTLKIGRK